MGVIGRPYRCAMSFTFRLALLTLSLLLPATAEAGDIRLDQMQILGSHNSYRPVLSPDLIARYEARHEDYSGSLYGHPDIKTQLDLGIRQIEFDPYSDRKGGLYAAPYAGTPDHAVMMQPGPKVLHSPFEDYHSHCLTLDICFTQMADWSRAHPGHDLIVIFVNTKDDNVFGPDRAGDVQFNSDDLDGIDALARRVFGADRLVTPDAVRGDHATLREAVMAHHWPGLAASHDTFLLVLDSTPRVADLYRTGHPSLAGRAMFAFYDEAAPEAAIFNIQDPRPEVARIRRLTAAGFIVRTRADADTREARNHDLGRFATAQGSGAQIISTDYYPGAPDPLNLHFVVRMQDGFHQPNAGLTEPGKP